MLLVFSPRDGDEAEGRIAGDESWVPVDAVERVEACGAFEGMACGRPSHQERRRLFAWMSREEAAEGLGRSLWPQAYGGDDIIFADDDDDDGWDWEATLAAGRAVPERSAEERAKMIETLLATLDDLEVQPWPPEGVATPPAGGDS